MPVLKKDKEYTYICPECGKEFKSDLMWPSCPHCGIKITICIRCNKEFKRRTKPMEIVAGEQSCYNILVFIALKMELYWKSKPIGRVQKNLPFYKSLMEKGEE